MAHIIIQHQVADFDTWRPIYEADGPGRQAAGVKDIALLRDADDPNSVWIVHEGAPEREAERMPSAYLENDAPERRLPHGEAPAGTETRAHANRITHFDHGVTARACLVAGDLGVVLDQQIVDDAPGEPLQRCVALGSGHSAVGSVVGSVGHRSILARVHGSSC